MTRLSLNMRMHAHAYPNARKQIPLEYIHRIKTMNVMTLEGSVTNLFNHFDK